MNSRLERVLNRISTKQILYERQRNQEQDKEHQLEVADKELENATKQLAFYKIELDRAKEKVEDANDASVMEDLNAQLKEAETRNKKLIKAKRGETRDTKEENTKEPAITGLIVSRHSPLPITTEIKQQP